MDEFGDDDFGDLYADVELQVSSAINAIQALTQLPPEEEEVHDNGDKNCDFQEAADGVGGAIADAEEEEAEGEENGNESESESEDDFNIVLNDDVDAHSASGNVSGGKVGLQSGRDGGGVVNDEGYGIEEDNDGKGVEDGGGSGGERSHGGKGGCSDGGHNSQYKYMKSHSTAFSSNLKSNGSTAASYSSTFIRGDCENDGCTYWFGRSLTGSQSGRNFSLPCSRTILDVNIDALEQKHWRNPGADITDFFNFGFDEDSWKSYCDHMDRCRGQTTKVTGKAAYWHARHSKDREAGSECVLQEAATENIVHCNQRSAVNLTNEISCRQPQSEMLKGRAIQVENGLGERQPSTETRLPIERDSDVVIQIPLQDLEEDHSNSGKGAFDETTNYLHEASQDRELGVDDAGDMLSFSASEDELPVLEGPAERTGKSDPHMSELQSKHTSTCDCDPSCLDSDNYGILHVFDADEQQHQVMDCDSDGTAEALKASDDPKRSVGRGKPTTTSKKTPESSKSEQNQHTPSSSPSQSDCVGSRGGAYGNPDKFHDHSKRASPSSASELRESITFEYHSSKGSRRQGVSTWSGNYKYIARSRSPVRRNIKFQSRKSITMSGLKSHLDDYSASHMSDAEEFNDAHHPAVGCHKQRNRHHDDDSYEERDYLYHEELEHSLNYRGARFSSNQAGTAYGYPHEKDNQDCGYEGDRYHGRNVNGKQHFPKQRIPRLRNEVMERNWNHNKDGIFVREMDSLYYDVSRQLITEKSPVRDNGNHTQSKRKADELHFKRRMKNDDFSAERNYSKKFTRENYRPMSYNGRESDYLENRHDRHLQHSRREVKSSLKSKRRYDSLPHDCETIRRTDCENERSRCAGNRLSFHSYREPRTAGRGGGRAAPFSRNGMFQRHGRWRRQNYVERYRGSNKLDGYADGYINDDQSIKDTDDHDDFLGRRQYQRSEVLHWLEEEYSRHLEDNFEAGWTFCPFERTPRCKGFYSKPGSCRVGKLIDGREPDQRRCKLPIGGDTCSQFDRCSSCVHRDNLGQARPSCWDSTDSHMVVGDGKSSRCFKAGSLMYYGRYDYLDWNDDPETRTFKDFNDSHFKVIEADSPKIDGFQDDANWCKKFSDSLQKDSLDIEEGQIVTEDLNNKPMQKASASEDTTKFIGVKNFPSKRATHENIDVEGLENPRIMEILAKMEKRRERFQQPVTLKNVSENHFKPFADSNAGTAETKVQRPARKRKWDGS